MGAVHARVLGRGRSRNRPGEDSSLRGRGGLRRDDQPGHRRRPDPRWRRAGRGRRALREDHVRGGRAAPVGDVHGLPDPDHDGDPRDRDPPHRDAVGHRLQLSRRRRRRHDRRTRGDHQCGGGCPRRPRRPDHRTAPPADQDPRARRRYPRAHRPIRRSGCLCGVGFAVGRRVT